MSELTSYNSERIYWSVEQVEREAGDIDDLHLDDNLFYLKSEADKVIADLEESHKKEVGQLLIEIRRLENLCASYRHDCDNLAIREANALKEIGRDNRVIRHHKYKRCLAMAKWCSSEVFVSDYEKDEPRMRWWIKWHKRWLELAEKFKEAK